MNLNVKDIVLLPILATLAFAAKLILAPIANVELVSLLLCVYTVALGLKRGLFIALIFTTITVFESAYYGAGEWIIMYFINWPALAILTHLFLRKRPTEWPAAIMLGLYGLLFDATGIIIHFFFYGPAGALAYLISGIPFSAIHGAANYILGLVLFKPLLSAMTKANERM